VEQLSIALESIEAGLDSTTVSQFARLLQRLQEGNRLFNLSGLRDAAAVVQRHFVESIALGRCLDERGFLSGEPSVLDLGSGAGFPGLPLKLVWPRLRLTLLEATSKKAHFITTTAEALELTGVRVLTGRAETLAHQSDLREAYDVVVARAVAPLPALVELTLPFLRVGGMLAAVKGSHWNQELVAASEALRVCGGELFGRVVLAPDGQVSVLLIRKLATTPAQYPRRPGQPAAHPLRRR